MNALNIVSKQALTPENLNAVKDVSPRLAGLYGALVEAYMLRTTGTEPQHE